MKTNTIFKLNCLCCGKEVEIDILAKIQMSEHLCSFCAKLDSKSYVFALLASMIMNERRAALISLR
jgi:hypothetical protein